MTTPAPSLWPAPGTPLGGPWKLSDVSSKGDAARLVIVDDGGRKVTLVLAPEAKDGRKAPLEVGGAQVFYEATQVPFAAFLPAARAVAEYANRASGQRLVAALKAWLAATPRTEMPGQKPVGQRAETLRIGVGAPLATALERARALKDNPGAIGLIDVLDGATVDELTLLFDALAIEKRQFAVRVDGRVMDDDARVGVLARLAGSRRFEVVFRTDEAELARRVVSRLPQSLRPEPVVALQRADASELLSLGALGRALKGSGRAYIAVDLPPIGAMTKPLDQLALDVEAALGPEVQLRRRIRSAAGTPYCLVPLEVSRALTGDPGHTRSDGTFGPGCSSCAVRPTCSGISREYAEKFGTSHLRPVTSHAQVQSPRDLDWKAKARLLLTNRTDAALTLGDLVPEKELPSRACLLPWTRLELDLPLLSPALAAASGVAGTNGGRFGPCCSQNQNYPPHAPTNNVDVRQLWASDYMRRVRRHMVAAETESPCRSTCPILVGQTQRPRDFRFHGGPAAVVENQIRLVEEVMAGVDEVTSVPTSIAFQTTTYCNHNCLMCEYGEMGSLSDERPRAFYDALETWLDRLVDVDVNGGEPLASPEFRAFLDRIDFAARPQLRINLVTNGSYLTPKQQDKWGRVRFGSLIVSLNAAKSPTYEEVNRGLPFERIKENLAALHERRRAGDSDARVTYSMVVLRQNLHEIQAFGDLALQDDVDVRYMLPFGNRNRTSFMGDRAAMEEVRTQIERVAETFDRAERPWVARDLRGQTRVLEDELRGPMLKVIS